MMDVMVNGHPFPHQQNVIARYPYITISHSFTLNVRVITFVCVDYIHHRIKTIFMYGIGLPKRVLGSRGASTHELDSRASRLKK
jgi:hypothetical protein